MKVHFKRISEKPHSLAIVKAIINYSGKGLKDSKDMYDEFRYNGTSTVLELSEEKAHEFIKEVAAYGLECTGGRSEKIKRFYKAQSECPDFEDILEFMDYNYHITALNKKDGCRYMITDFDGSKNAIVGMKYGEVWKTCLYLEDFHEFEINHISYSQFHLKYYNK